jgi:IclR family acetate operon transcriptional repressor
MERKSNGKGSAGGRSNPRGGEGEGPYAIRAVQRVCDILDLLQQEPGGTSLARAAEVTELPKSSAFRYLATLEERRYVERDPESGEFRLGLGLLPMEARQLKTLIRRVRPHLERLQQEFQETANLGLLDGDSVVYLDIVESDHTMRLAARPNDRDSLHATALGKAIAAELPLDRVREVIRAQGLPALTERTITSESGLLETLEKIRAEGHSVDDGENEVGALCVARALRIGDLYLAISVSGPIARFTPERVPLVATRLEQVTSQIAADFSISGEAAAA